MKTPKLQEIIDNLTVNLGINVKYHDPLLDENSIDDSNINYGYVRSNNRDSTLTETDISACFNYSLVSSYTMILSLNKCVDPYKASKAVLSLLDKDTCISISSFNTSSEDIYSKEYPNADFKSCDSRFIKIEFEVEDFINCQDVDSYCINDECC